jgi:hypothetical protein
MSRTIITRRDVARSQASAAAFPQFAVNAELAEADPIQDHQTPDDYKTKLMKNIPGEVIALYVTIDAMVRTSAHSPGEAKNVYWFLFVFGLVVTPLYLWRITQVRKITQLVISAGAFGVWVFALGGPFTGLSWYEHNQLFAGIVLPIYTFCIPLIDP